MAINNRYIIKKATEIAQGRWDKIKNSGSYVKEDAVIYALEYLDEIGYDFDLSRREYEEIHTNVI